MKRGVQDTFATNDGFDNKLVDPFKKVFSLLFADVIGKEVSQRSETPFASKIFLIFRRFLKFGVFFVDTVIGQMLKLPTFRIFGQVIIDFSRESGQAFFIDINPEGVNAGYGHVDSQVEFESVDEQRAVDVMTDNERRVSLKLGLDDFERGRYRDTLALRTVVRLGDVRVLIPLHLFF